MPNSKSSESMPKMDRSIVKDLRLPGEDDAAFRERAIQALRVAKCLVAGCLQNEFVQYLISTGEWTEQQVRTCPTVRVEYEQAYAIGGIGETLSITNSKYWGDGPWIMPLEVDDVFYSERITYFYRPTSLYNMRFEQRKRLKELLGKEKSLVEKAKYSGWSKKIYLQNTSQREIDVVRRVLGISIDEFWRACRGKTFLTLPTKPKQLSFDF